MILVVERLPQPIISPSQHSNLDLDNVFTPVNAEQLDRLLIETEYDTTKRNFIVEGFRNGFDLGYRGPENVKIESPNLRFTIGSEFELWEKVMKEVKAKRYAGPFSNPPFEFFIQSPIGLVPKDNGKKTRLIFHLSFPKKTKLSVNANTPSDLCSVKYKDFDSAVRLCLKAGKGCAAGKSDFSAAFRHLPIAKKFWKFLVMKAKNPVDKRWYYFVDKCLPFGSSRSCALFQEFSDCMAHIMKVKSGGHENVNYLDDFLFVALLKLWCDQQITLFIRICRKINFPVSLDKTFYGCTRITFLGLLIDTVRQLVCVPQDKLITGRKLIELALNKRSLRLNQLQQITGFLNFLGKAIVPGRAFTRRIYAQEKLVSKKHHHIPMSHELKQDLTCWKFFLETPQCFSRPFFDFDSNILAEKVELASDASRNPHLGAGGICQDDWYILQWDEEFIIKEQPSINYLELYAVTVMVLNWVHRFKNKRISLACDNMSVVHMLNNSSSKCKNCMVLIRIVVLQSLVWNVNIKAHHITSKANLFPDLLSRLKYKLFWQTARKLGRKFAKKCTPIPTELWPMSKVWLGKD